MATITLGPAEVNLAGIRAGDINAIDFYVHRGDEPVDLTGLDISAQARPSPTDSVVLTARIEVDFDPGSGRFTLYWDGEDVRALLAGKASWTGVWDVQLGTVIDSLTYDVTTIAAGTFAASMDVTK